MAVRIKRSVPKKFNLKLRTPSGDPHPGVESATEITIKFKTIGGSLSINTQQVPADKAFKLSNSVTYTAAVAGVAGNLIILPFDGIETIDSVINTWNGANPGNTVVSDAATPAVTVPVAGTVTLEEGQEAFFNVKKPTLANTANLAIVLSGKDTKDLRIGPNQSIDVLLDNDANFPGADNGEVIPNAINVVECESI
jgi:hypothetical protein